MAGREREKGKGERELRSCSCYYGHSLLSPVFFSRLGPFSVYDIAQSVLASSPFWMDIFAGSASGASSVLSAWLGRERESESERYPEEMKGQFFFGHFEKSPRRASTSTGPGSARFLPSCHRLSPRRAPAKSSRMRRRNKNFTLCPSPSSLVRIRDWGIISGGGQSLRLRIFY